VEGEKGKRKEKRKGKEKKGKKERRKKEKRKKNNPLLLVLDCPTHKL